MYIPEWLVYILILCIGTGVGLKVCEPQHDWDIFSGFFGLGIIIFTFVGVIEFVAGKYLF